MSLCGKKNTGGPIFGEPLDVAAERSDPFKLVPYVLRASFGYLNKRGLDFEGLYRINGGKKTVQHYISRYDKGEKLNFLELSKKEPVSPCNIASLILYYFKNLPENILTNDLEEEFFKVAEFKDMAEKVKHVKKNVNRLPPCNKQTLKLYIEHLVFVAEKQDVNQMTVENLLLCITGASSNTPVFFVLILNYEEIFLGVTPTKEEKIQKLEKLNYVITTDSLMPKAKDGEYEGKDSKEEDDEEVELKEVTIKEVVKQEEEVSPTLEVLKQEEEEKKVEMKQEVVVEEIKQEEKKVEQHEEEEEEKKVEKQEEEEKKVEQHEEETSVEKQEEELNQMVETLEEMEKPEEKETKQELKEMEQLQEELELKQESHLLEEKQNLDEKIETPQPSSESNHQVLPEETKKEEEHQ